ncbi:MAG: serine/threonine protein kinase [Cyanobacteria bacterium]|nr:serine/threonine protein kinase [Cyanobacteriota bacterium]
MTLHPKHPLSNRYFFSRTQQNADQYQSYWIRYKLQRVMRKRAFTGRKGKAIFLSVVTLVFFIVSLGQNVSLPYAGCLLILGWLVLTKLNPFLLLTLFFPTHVEFTEKGIRYHWLRMWCRMQSPSVPWDRISHVTTRSHKIAGGTDEIILEFNAISRGFSFPQRLAYFVLAPFMSWGWLTSDRSQLLLNVDGIASSDDRARLQLAIKKYLPSYRIEPKVADDLSMFIKFDSHTDFWLEKLGEFERSRETSLEDNTLLNDGAYKITGRLGSGGQATVYTADMLKAIPEVPNIDGARSTNETVVDFSNLEETKNDSASSAPTNLSVVLKEFVLPTEAGTNVRKRVLTNIQKEAKLWRKLNHPNIVRLLDFFIEDQRAYLVLETASGITLKEYVEQNQPLDEQQVLKLAIQMCDILSYLHRRQPPIVHRDFTPDNIVIDNEQTLRLIDFNVAQQLEAQNSKTVVGKHAYIPPEQFRGNAVPQSDIYACGATLFYLLTAAEPEPISQAHPRELRDMSSQLDSIIAKTTSLTLANRYQDTLELKSDLLALMS